MCKQIDALTRQLLTLMQAGQQLKAAQKEFRQALRALIDRVRQLKCDQQRERHPRAGEVGVAS
ncbi:MAG TPA: hypothetical protein VNP04_00260 [Alphaproteobacteria bacterium]|nr:hypothetical protein [Alphaproteobacteria bacterium]